MEKLASPQSARPTANILIFGSLNMDFILEVKDHAGKDGHVHATSDRESPGGHGANQAIACMRLSRHSPSSSGVTQGRRFEVDFRVSMVGAVGSPNWDHDFGTKIKDKLKLESVDTMKVRTVEHKTGYAHIHVNRAGETRVTTYDGANAHLLPGHISLPNELPDLILVQLETPLETVRRVIEVAHEGNVPVLLNAAPPTKTPKESNESIYGVDVLVVNQLGANKFMSLESTDGWHRSQYFEACGAYHAKGAKMVIITLGEKGVVASRSDGGGEPQVWSLDAVHVEDVRDTTGASDAFIGGYAVEMLRQKKMMEPENIEKTLKMGMCAGALVVRGVGSMDPIPFRDQVELEYNETYGFMD